MAQMRHQMDDMFQNFLGKADNRQSGTNIVQSNNFFDPDIEIQDKKTYYLISLDITDLDKNKVNVDIKDDSINISGQYSKDTKENGPGGQISSHSYGSMFKSLPLPKDADTGKVKTDIKGNQLTITIPKKKR